MFDHIMSVLDVLLLVVIVAQGEYVRYYEREVHRMTRERFEERARWREQKRQQQLKKEAALKTSDSSASLELLSPSETLVPPSKTTNVKSAAALSTPTATPVWIIFISILKRFVKLMLGYLP